MKRRQLIELEDLAWFPSVLRSGMTAWLQAIHRVFRTSDLYAPIVADLLRASGTTQIVDLCSGGGGCLPGLLETMERRYGVAATATMTDRYPNAAFAERVNARKDPRLTYRTTPVDATAVPADLVGARTLVAGFHHLPPDLARGVLLSAAREGRPICVLEATANHPVAIVIALFLPVFVLLTTPLVRPIKPSQLLLTYAFPLLPLLIFWDGFVSNLRTYSQQELRVLADSIGVPGYRWTVGGAKPFAWSPVAFPYLTGRPER